MRGEVSSIVFELSRLSQALDAKLCTFDSTWGLVLASRR